VGSVEETIGESAIMQADDSDDDVNEPTVQISKVTRVKNVVEILSSFTTQFFARGGTLFLLL
jgi:hypothetical protein